MLTTTQSYVTYQGNGATTAFPYNFLVQQAGHIVVSIANNNVSPAATTVLTASQYSVTGIGNAAGGTLTYPVSGSPLPSGWTITIQRVVPYQQNTSLTNQGAFYPQVVEAALDYLTMIAQQIGAGTSPTSPVLPAWISGINTLADSNGNLNSASPTLAGLYPVYKTANTCGTTVTGFIGMVAGHYFKIIIGDTFTTIGFGVAGATIKGHNGQNWTPGVGDILDCVSDGTNVYAIDSGTLATLEACINSQVSSTPSTGLSGLNITNDATTPNTKIDLTANAVEVSDGTHFKVIGNVNVAIDCTTVGANGLSAGSLAAFTWYYVWVINNGTTTAGLVSTSPTTPIMPSGYSYKRLLGVAITDSSAHFLVFVQQGNRFIYDGTQQISMGTAAQSWTTQNCAGFIPPVSTRGLFQLTVVYASTAMTCALRKNGSASNMGHVMGYVTSAGTSAVVNDWIDTDSSQVVQLNVPAAATTWVLRANGFELNL